MEPKYRFDGAERDAIEALADTDYAFRRTYAFAGDWVDAAHRALAEADYGWFSGPDDAPLFPGEQPRGPGHLRHEVMGWLNRGDVLKLYEMAHFCEGNILEIGCGLSTILLGSAVTPAAGWLCSIELDEARVKRTEQAAAARGIFPVCRCGRSEVLLCDVDPRSVALAFVDGGHSYEDCAGDCRQMLRVLAPGGFVLFHDFAARENADEANPHVKVWQAVHDVVAPHFEFWGISGITGIFRKPL